MLKYFPKYQLIFLWTKFLSNHIIKSDQKPLNISMIDGWVKFPLFVLLSTKDEWHRFYLWIIILMCKNYLLLNWFLLDEKATWRLFSSHSFFFQYVTVEWSIYLLLYFLSRSNSKTKVLLEINKRQHVIFNYISRIEFCFVKFVQFWRKSQKDKFFFLFLLFFLFIIDGRE